MYSRMNFNSETWKKFDARVNVNHRCEFTRVSSCASQPGVFQFRAEMFVRRADKIIQENSREERERERARYHFEISKILACRVEKKKVEDFFLPRRQTFASTGR